jgi:hypothetical protein
MTFKLSREHVVKRRAVAADLRDRARTLNITIAAFNREIGPLSQAVGKALDDYHEVLENARGLTGEIAETARAEFDAKSEKWQDSEKGLQVRIWIEQREMSLDGVDLDLPEPLEEIDPDERASDIEDGPVNPVELEPVYRQ